MQGEQTLSPEQLQETVPDLVSPQGEKIVTGLLNKAGSAKPELDNTFKLIAAAHGLDPVKDFESRLKDPETLVRKVALHRLEGKDKYRANDVNDLYGGRFIAKTPDQKKDIINAIKELDENNQIKIDKAQQVTHDTYHAYHIDFNKNGIKGEVQIHDPHSLFESVVNHEIRAQFGEKPGQALEAVKYQNSQQAYALPAQQAQQQAQTLEAAKRAQNAQKAPPGLLNAQPVLTQEDRDMMGQFAQLVETKKDKGNLGTLGQTANSLAENLYGKKAGAWSNKQIKEAFDLTVKRAYQGR